MKEKCKIIKQIFTIVLSMVLMLSCVPFSSLTVYGAPEHYNGTAVTPQQISADNYKLLGLTDENWSNFKDYYAIRNASELYGFANHVNSGSSSSSAVLLQDIVINTAVSESGADYNWTPLGYGRNYETKNYYGTFDGNGYSISGLYFSNAGAAEGSCVGFVRNLTLSGTVKNLTLKNSYISGHGMVGAIVGCMQDNAGVTNCRIESSVTVKGTEQYIGGICGYYYGETISNCTVLAKVSSDTYHTGAIVGYRGNETEDILSGNYYLKGCASDVYGTVTAVGDDDQNSATADKSGECTALASATAPHANAAMTDIVVNGYTGTYDGKAHSISVTAPDGATVTYSTDGTAYSAVNPTFTDATEKTVHYKITKANHNEEKGTATVKIEKADLTVKANDHTIIYGDRPAANGVSYSGFVNNETENVLGGTLAYEYSYEQYGDVGNTYTITPGGLTSNNYNITFQNGTLTVEPKEIDISWDATQFLPYNGSSLVSAAEVTNLVNGDKCTLTTEVVETTEGAGIIPGIWTAKVTKLSNGNYKLPESGERVTASFEIVNGNQNDAPEVSCVNETIDGKADGKITGVDKTMEYRKDGETTYTTISGTEITGLADGIYYVRYAAKTYYDASPEEKVVIGVGKKLTVTVPSTQMGYKLTTEAAELVWNGSTTITYSLSDGYTKTEDFAVKVNGNKVDLTNNQYVVSNAQKDITVTVEGVADITAPEAEITLGKNTWDTFLNKITFELFFDETQTVKVSAKDVNTGSGLNKIYYYLASEKMTRNEVKAITDWTEYKDGFTIKPTDEYVIYVKAVDKAGNETYINSNGLVLDATAPVITGVKKGGTYYGDTTFGVTEEYLDTVKVDGETVKLTDGKYTITADGEKHTIVAVDKAGNSSETVKINLTAIDSLDDTIEDLKTSTVKSNDKEAIEKVLNLVDNLLDSDKDFTEDEEETLEEIKADAEKLLDKIEEAEKAEAAKTTVPSTGDSSNMLLWITSAMISGIALLGILIKKRSK